MICFLADERDFRRVKDKLAMCFNYSEVPKDNADEG